MCSARSCSRARVRTSPGRAGWAIWPPMPAGRAAGPQARIVLDEHGSFAGTFGMMAEDRAMVGGVLGLLPDDERLFRSFELARRPVSRWPSSSRTSSESDHPNAVKFVLTGESGRTAEIVGNSTGGGMVETVSVDGFPLRVIGDSLRAPRDGPGGRWTRQARGPRGRRCRRRSRRTRSAAEGTRRAARASWSWPMSPSARPSAPLAAGLSARGTCQPPATGAARRRASRPQAAALRHDDALARARRARRAAALGGRGPVRDRRLGLVAGAGRRAHARGWPALMRRQTRAAYEEDVDRADRPVQARLRRPVGASRSGTPRSGRRTASRPDHPVGLRRGRRHPRRGQRARARWAAAAATCTPP